MDGARIGTLAAGSLVLAWVGVSAVAHVPAPPDRVPAGRPTLRQAERPASRAAEPTSGHQRMLMLLQQIADDTPDNDSYHGDKLLREARADLAALPASAPATVQFAVHGRVAVEAQRMGYEDESIEHFQRNLEIVRGAPDEIPVLLEFETLYRLAIAYLRRAETENCIEGHHAASCRLPFRGDSMFVRQDDVRQAIPALTTVLRASLEGTPRYLEVRWVLNLAYMMIGAYPDQVPEAYRIPPEAFESAEQIPHFTDIAPQLGLDTLDLSGGAIADDFDNDGYLDLVVSTWDQHGQMRFFRNNRDGTFADRTEPAGLLGLLGGLDMVQGDYDNDGNVDIYILRGAWLEEKGRHPNSLLRNNGDGTFTDRTFEAGLGLVHYPNKTASWSDYDNDGDLDLYVGSERSEAMATPSQLFRNNGDGTFTDVAAAAGVLNDRFAQSVIWGDYDGDRWPDLFVSNQRDRNRLYHNNGDGTFTDVAESLGVTEPLASFPSWFWDVDNDGNLDLLVNAFAAEASDVAARALGLPGEVELSRLYRGVGDGRFEDVSEQFGVARPNAPMGSNFGDLDNDGYLDFYLGTGHPPLMQLMPNVMYHNTRGTGFVDVSVAGGFSHIEKGHGVAFADFDNDGDSDVFEQMGGAYPADPAHNALYENPGFGHHWITVKLEGVRSNRSAIGARIRADIIENGELRSVYRHVNSGGTFGANPLRQTIGLGQATRIERLDVFWPASGMTQTWSEVPVDRAIRIVEGEDAYSEIVLERLTLGAR